MNECASGLPTLSEGVATKHQILRSLDLTEVAPGGGALLTGGMPSTLTKVA